MCLLLKELESITYEVKYFFFQKTHSHNMVVIELNNDVLDYKKQLNF